MPREDRQLRRGLLLRNAVDISATEDDLLGLNADALVDALAPDLVVDLLERVNGKLIVLVAVLRDDNAVVGDQVVHVGGDQRLVGNAARRSRRRRWCRRRPGP